MAYPILTLRVFEAAFVETLRLLAWLVVPFLLLLALAWWLGRR